jgi:hypothetical protein
MLLSNSQKLNPEKTEVINVSKALQTHPKKYIVGDQEINRVQSIKHLGITYQENGKINIVERLSISRRIIYALLGPTKSLLVLYSRRFSMA